MRLQLLLMQLLLCVLPGMEMGASCRLTAWVVEDSSGKVEITCIGDGYCISGRAVPLV